MLRRFLLSPGTTIASLTLLVLTYCTKFIPQRGMRYKKMLPVDMALSPYRPESFDGFVKNKLPGKFFSIIKLFFCIVQKFFVPRGVKIYR